MYGSIGDGALVEMRETLFDKEVDLQDFLTSHQGLLAGDQMNPANPRRFVLVTAEAGIAISEDGGRYFSLDHLFIDQDGIPTLVEVKRSTDTRLRREVLGQMLDYAANACAFWNADRLKAVFERRCAQASLDPSVELQRLDPNGEVAPDDIWDKVSTNLQRERLRLVFIADKFPPEMQRIVEFLNRQMQLTEVYAVEVRQYAGPGMKTLAPRVLNPSLLQADRRTVASGSGETWTTSRFFEDLQQRHGADAVTVFQGIDEWARLQPHLAVLFGSGKSHGSMQIVYKNGLDKSKYESGEGDTVILLLWTSGTVEIAFQYLMNRQAFASPESREALRVKLMTASTLEIPLDKIEKRPNLLWSQFAEPGNLDSLFAALTWIIEKLDESRVESKV